MNNDDANNSETGLKVYMTIVGRKHRATFDFSLKSRRHHCYSNRIPVTIGGKQFTLVTILQPEP